MQPWEEKFLELVFHNDLPKPPGLKTYANAERSFVLITIYVAINMGKFNLLEQRVYLGLAVVLCIGLTIVSAAGLCLYIGYIPTEIHNLMPFLILGIGIDDSLVIIQCLENVVSKERTLNPEKRVGEALRQAGASITITSITDVFAFAIGATTRVPVLRSFCIYTTAGIFIVYVMTLIFMVPILSLDERRRDSGREGCLCIRLPADYKKNSCSQKLLLEAIFRRIVRPLLVKTPVKVVVVLLTMSLLGLNCWGLSGLKNDFDRTWFFNPGYQRDFVSAVLDLFPESGYRADFYLEDYPKTEAAFEQKLSTFLVFTNQGRKFISDLQYTGNLLTDFNLTASRGRYQHIYFNTREEKRQGLHEVEEVLHGVQFKGRDPFRGILTVEYLVIRSKGASGCIRGAAEESRSDFGRSFRGDIGADWRPTGLYLGFSCILFTLIGIAGSMRFAGLTIELMSSILLILSVGLTVDYSTHIAHKYLVIWFSVIYGLYHGLVYLPVMLSWFGPQAFVDLLHSTKNSSNQSGLDLGQEEASETPDARMTYLEV
ncbi:unnamed protein product [Darwinula stevensoni]|uniref:SSD domain-containing protein n=1 Tax=Darwinula stevensoni TaxID=69355 RepID=A0A7R9AG24_9CRUS|nr:unnamed protein product [Darwinula stevensoni]CAG0903247.1 unnamed protein product [Darwinula stevensoni]